VFVVAVGRAIAVGAECGCFGRLGRGPAGGRELGRAVAMTIASGCVAGARLAGTSEVRFGWATVVGAVGVALMLLAGQAIGSRARLGRGSPAAAPPAWGSALSVPALRDAVGLDNELYAPARAERQFTPPSR